MLGCRNHFMPCMFPDINQEDCQQVIALLRDCGSHATVNTACIYFQVIVCGEKSKVAGVNEHSLQLRGVHLQFSVHMCFLKVAELVRTSDGPSGQSPSESETCFLQVMQRWQNAGCRERSVAVRGSSYLQNLVPVHQSSMVDLLISAAQPKGVDQMASTLLFL